LPTRCIIVLMLKLCHTRHITSVIVSKNKHQSGFAGIEIVIAVIVVLAAGALALWRYWPSFQPRKTYTDAAHVYQLSYPAQWRVDYQDSDSSIGKAIDSKDPRFYPNDGLQLPCNAVGCGGNVNGISVSAYHHVSTESWLRQNGWEPLNVSMINGNQAYQSETPGGLDVYFIQHNGVTVELDFRVKQNGGISTFDDTAHKSSFDTLAHTVKFLP